MIVTTGWPASGVTTRAYSDTGTQLWTLDYGDNSSAVAFDATGNIVVAGNIGIKKYDNSGNFLWAVTSIGAINVVAIDSSGNIYTGGSLYGGYTTRKFDADGNLIFGVSHGAAGVSGIATDEDGNIYTGGGIQSSITTRKYDSSGNLLWSVNNGYQVNDIAVRSGVLVTVGNYVSASNKTIRAYNLSGTELWNASYGASNYGVAIDSAGNVYTVGNGVSGYSKAFRKYNSSGVSQWAILTNYNLYAIAIDASNEIYIGGEQYGSYTTYKYSSAGTLRFSANHGTYVNGIAWLIPPVGSTLPALPLSVLPAVPAIGFGVTPSPLALRIAASVPTATDPPLPPELAGFPVAKIYRAWLSTPGGSELLELPFFSLQCTRRYNESTWIALTLPTYSVALEAAVSARIGGELVIDAGYRLAGGNEARGLFLRATLTEYATERTRDGGSITLTARVIPTAYTNQPRTLAGIRNQSTADGRNTVICTVDPLLRPHDVVTAARGVSFIVGAIRYAIGPRDAVMELTEAR